MNNKGFTLVELLAVLIVLTTILLIAIPSITSSVERNKQKIKNKKIEVIESAAVEYGSKYKNKFEDYSKFTSGDCCLPVSELETVGLLTSKEVNDADDNKISGYVCFDNGNYSYTNIVKTSCEVN